MDTLESISQSAKGIQGTIDELLERFNSICTFEEATVWDSDTEAAIKLVEKYINRIRQFVTDQEHALEELQASRAKLPVVKRLFASHKEEDKMKEELETARKGIATNEETIEALYELIDRTPSSKKEQSEMLNEYRQLKKELTTEKRAVNEEMRKIRAEARSKTTGLSGISGRGFIGSAARYSRSSIRYQKESALRPNEDAKGALERQLIETEKRINWISKFSGTDPGPAYYEAVLRCSYCGRRVEPNSVCPGCGSDHAEQFIN